MKTIAYVIPQFPVASETFIVNEMEAMQALGHSLIPCTLHQDKTAPCCQPTHAYWLRQLIDLQKVPYWRLGLAMGWCGINRSAWQFLQQQRHWPRRSLWLAALRLAVVVRQQRCDHIHAHFAQQSAAVAIVAARLVGVTVSFVGHGADVYQAPYDLPLKLRHADLAIAVCQPMLAQFQQQAPATASALIRCGINLAQFRFHAPCLPKARLLFVGRLVEKKGLDLLLAALRRLPPKQRLGLDVIGQGPLLTSLQQLAQQWQLDVRFLGFRDQCWLQSHGHQYQALVAPFRVAANGDRDTGPLVCKEAMALGIPVISSNIMGLPEIVNDECGRLIAPEDSQALAQAILWLQQRSAHQRHRMAIKGRQRVERLFCHHQQAAQLSALIERLA